MVGWGVEVGGCWVGGVGGFGFWMVVRGVGWIVEGGVG